MPVFEYTALDSKGKKKSGIIDADSASGARAKLRQSGSFPVNVKEAPEVSQSKEGKGFSISLGQGWIPAKYISIMTRQLSTLVGAGLPIVSALESLINQSPHPTLQKTLAHVKDDIVEGKSFADALSVHPKAFSPLYINMVRAGEASGAIEIVLGRLADLMERNEATKSSIRSAMTYPIIMILAAFVIITILMVKVVPTITTLFDHMGRVLPLPTRILIATSNAVTAYWWIMLLAAALAVFGLWRFKKSKKGGIWWDGMLLRVPIMGDLIVKLSMARFSRTLASLLQNGVTLVPAMGIVSNVVENKVIAGGIVEAVDLIGEGGGLGQSLTGKTGFPPVTLQMMEVGEQSGELEAMLDKVADLHQTESENMINALTTSLEPVLILFMGVMVSFIVFSVLMPIVKYTTMIQ